MINKYLMAACSGLALVSSVVHAEIVTVDVSATVTYVNESGNALNGQMNVGDTLTGSYTFDTSTLDGDSNPESGIYPHAMGAGGMSFTVNGLTLATAQNSNHGAYVIDVTNHSGSDFYHVRSHENQTLASGAILNYIAIDLMDPSGAAHSSDALLNTAPVLSSYEIKDIHGDGMGANGMGNFNFQAKINSLSIANGSPNGAYKIAAIVREVYDPYGLLQGKINVGDAVSGGYAVDLAAVDTDPNPDHAYYMNPPEARYGFDLNISGINFKSDSLQFASEVHIQNSSSDHYHAIGRSGAATGANVNVGLNEIAIYLDDMMGQALSSTAQPVNGINVPAFNMKDLLISGSTSTGQFFHVIADLVSIESGKSPAITISPASDSVFVFYQRFDMAIILPAQVTAMPMQIRGNVNGMSEPYFSSSLCGPGPMNRYNQQVFICSDSYQVLRPGMNQIDLYIDLDDGTTLPAQFSWSLLD